MEYPAAYLLLLRISWGMIFLPLTWPYSLLLFSVSTLGFQNMLFLSTFSLIIGKSHGVFNFHSNTGLKIRYSRYYWWPEANTAVTLQNNQESYLSFIILGQSHILASQESSLLYSSSWIQHPTMMLDSSFPRWVPTLSSLFFCWWLSHNHNIPLE